MFAAIIMYEGLIGRPYSGDTYNYDGWQYYYSEDDNSLNVVAVGSSAMYRFWMPPLAYEEQGFTSINLGHSYQLFSALPYIIEELTKTQDPDLVMIEVRSLLNERQAVIDNTEDGQPDLQSWKLDVIASGMNYSSTRFNLIHDLYVDIEGDCELNWYIPVLKHHSLSYSVPITSSFSRATEQKHKYKTSSTYAYVAPIEDYSNKKELYGEYVLTDADKALIDSVIAAGEKYGVDIFFVSTPYTLTRERGSLQLSLQMYMEEKGYDYLDLNDCFDEIGLDPKTDYKDLIHTNVVGAEKVTSYLAKYIADNYVLDNVILTEAQIKEWETACKAYNRYSAALKTQWSATCALASDSDIASPSDT